MNCEKCKCRLYVDRNRDSDDTNTVIRIRVCPVCLARYITTEVVVRKVADAGPSKRAIRELERAQLIAAKKAE